MFRIIIALFLFLSNGCDDYESSINYSIPGVNSSSSSSSSTDPNSQVSSYNYFNAAKEAGPVISPALISSRGLFDKAANWSTGGTLYEVYQLIRDYEYPRDEGVIDGSNMYKAMHTVNTLFETSQAGEGDEEGEHDEGESDGCTSITEQSVTPPFNFGSDLISATYNCLLNNTQTATPVSGGPNTYYTSMVTKIEGQESNVTLGWAIVGSSTTRYAAQGYFNIATNQVKINLAYLVDYGGEKYSVRNYVNGNTETGLFTLKLIKCSLGENNYVYGNSISGYGYSQGSNYYLFRVQQGGPTVKYFCFESDTTEDEMKAMSDSGSETIPANCASYAANLPDNYDVNCSESPTSTNSFTGSGDHRTNLTTE